MSKSLVDTELDAGLDETKKKPRYFAVITKGQTIVKMIVQKKQIREGDIGGGAKREYGGNASIEGVCVRNGSELVLQVIEKEPAIKPVKIKEFIVEQTGATVKPKWQVVPALPDVPQDDDLQPQSRGASYAEVAAKQSPPPPAKQDEGVTYAEVQSKKTQQTQQTPVQGSSYAEVTGKQQKEGQEAVQAYGKTVPVDTTATTNQSGAQQPPADAPSDPALEKIKKALNESKTRIQQVIDTRPQYRDQVLALVGQVKGYLAQENGPLAMANFRELVALIATALKDHGAVEEEKQTDRLVTLQKSRVDWDSARKRLHAQLQSVAAAVEKECQNTEEYDQTEVKDKLKALDTIMEKLDTRLIDVLDQALNAKDALTRAGLEKQAVGIVNEYLTAVSTDPLVAAVDESGLINVPIQQSMTKLLTDLAGRLAT